MRKSSWKLGLLLALPLAALAVDVDGGAVKTGPADAGAAVQATADAHPLLLDMQAIAAERDGFARDFDWGAPADRAERLADYARAMDGFDRRALETKAAWLRAEGRAQEAEALDARVAASAEPREPRAELGLDRATGEPVEAGREETAR